MNKKPIIILLLALVAMAGQRQVKCHVEGTVAEGAKAVGLVIYRDGTDPKESFCGCCLCSATRGTMAVQNYTNRSKRAIGEE